MFVLNDDLSIYATRGDIVFFTVSAEENGELYTFKAGDVVRIKIYGKKDANTVLLEKDFPVVEDTEAVEIFLTKEDTKIGGVISKPVVYWYEVELNPRTNPQTLIGYDDDGAKEFRLFPEGKDLIEYVPDSEDIPFVDAELDLLSPRPLQNQAIARAIVQLKTAFEETKERVGNQSVENADAVAEMRREFSALLSGGTPDDSELINVRSGADNMTYGTAGDAVRGQYAHAMHNARSAGLFYPYAMRLGAVNSATGAVSNDQTRNTTTDFIKVKAGDKVYFDDDGVYDYSALLYDAEKTYVKETGWIHTDYEFDADYYVRINFCRRDGAELLETDAHKVQSILKVGTVFPVANEASAIAHEIVREHLEHFGIGLKFIEHITWGTFEGTTTVPSTRCVTPTHIPVVAGERIDFKANSTYKFGYRFYDAGKVYDGVDHGWNTESATIAASGYVKINFARTDNAVFTEEDFAELRKFCKIVSGESGESRDSAIQSISVEHGRYEGASYVFARIPKTTNSGQAVTPKLHLTSDDGSLAGAKKSALTYARENNCIFTINAGLFNVTTMQPVGQTIVDGVVLVSTPMQDDNGYPISDAECYPLCIDANGNMSAPYARSVDTAKMLADGVVTAVTGWGKIVEGFEPCPDTVENEIVHKGKYIRQVIGQFQNGDYFVCTVDQSRGKVENEAGLTYEQLAQLLIGKGVKFAYSLDGGGSAETVIGARQLNPIYEGTAGRAVPTVITFEC